MILESVLRISDHLAAGVALEQVQPSQVNCQDMLLCSLMSALVLAHLALVLPKVFVESEIVPCYSQTLLLANIDILSEKVMVELSRTR